MFHSLAEISPILLAFWRLQVTVWVLIPLGLHSIYCMTHGATSSSSAHWLPCCSVVLSKVVSENAQERLSPGVLDLKWKVRH